MTWIETALRQVRAFYPEVTQVLYLRGGYWVYMTETGDRPAFGEPSTARVADMAAKEAAKFHKLPAVFHITDFNKEKSNAACERHGVDPRPQGQR